MNTALKGAALQLAREEKRAKREALELGMRQQLMAMKLTKGMVREHRFHPTRAWRFDFAWPEAKLALEVEGGTWTKSRHTTGNGFEEDCEKYAAAVLAGWRVLRVTSGQVTKGTAVGWVKAALQPEEAPCL